MSAPESSAFRDAIDETAVLLQHALAAVRRARSRCRPGVHEFYTESVSKRLEELIVMADWLQQRAVGWHDPADPRPESGPPDDIEEADRDCTRQSSRTRRRASRDADARSRAAADAFVPAAHAILGKT